MTKLRHKFLIRAMRITDQLILAASLWVVMRPAEFASGLYRDWIRASAYGFAEAAGMVVLMTGWVFIHDHFVRYRADRFVPFTAEILDFIKATGVACFWLMLIALIVPGYGMAVSQAQHALREMGDLLRKEGVSVKYAIPAMRRAGGGSIIMMSSIAGIRGSAGLAGYSASKGAVRLFAKSVALECAGARDGIRCNSVHPGVIETDIWQKMPQGSLGGRNAPVDPRQLAANIVPLGEAGTAADIAAGVVFLASDASRHMTGSELVIDGGSTAGRAGTMPR